MVKMPSHIWSAMVHNAHVMKRRTIADAIEANMLGYQDDDWINVNEKAAALKTGNHWYIQWAKDRDSGEFFVASASDLGKLLEYMTTVEYA
ncbi:hypothetical protein [Rhizobium phage RHph_N46]|nr:hypothetical protein [Rhizobium phage RHph_N46]